MNIRSAIAYQVLWFLDTIIPKHPHVIVCTWPDLDDQGLAVAAELQTRGYDVTWLTHGSPREVSGRAFAGKAISRRSIAGLWRYLRSGYIFYTHGIFGFARPVRNKVVVNLWHGMPIKKIGIPDGQHPMSFTYTVATGEVFRNILAESWKVPSDRVLVTGLPRNDRLLRDGTRTGHERGASPSRAVIWLPTYRRSLRGERRSDGVVDPNRPGGLMGFDSQQFEVSLARLGLACVMKLHPMASKQDYPCSTAHFDVRDDEAFVSRGQTLYELLGSSLALITDVSSVWVDYLLLDRPIIFAFGDSDEYEKDRGYTLGPVRDWLPGRIVETADELLVALESLASGDDEFREQRQRMLARLHTYYDGRSTRRLLDKLGLI